MTGDGRRADRDATRALALSAVAGLGERRRTTEAETPRILGDAYATGVVTWREIATALGTTPSVAWHLAHPDEGPPED